NKGLAFDGRTAEEFKLANGTWVSAGKLRVQVVQAVDGALADAVVCGLNQDEVCLLGFLNEGYCQRLVGESLSIDQLSEHPQVIQAVRTGLEKHNLAHPNAAGRIARIALMKTPPQADAGEITEKGYINQNKAQSLRQTDVERLYTRPAGPGIIRV
ncbi:MAG: feruloyl-CoA synthase, partial [Pseudomonadota bacterium]